MALGAVMIAMNGILGANSSPFGTPLYARGPTTASLANSQPTMSNDMGMSGFLSRQAQAAPTMSNDMGMSNFLNRQAQEAVPVQNMSSGIGSLLEPIQAHLIQRYNQARVVPLLNNFERQLMQLAGGQGGGMPTNPAMEVYSGQPQQRVTTMGPESLAGHLQARRRALVEPGGFDASEYLQ